MLFKYSTSNGQNTDIDNPDIGTRLLGSFLEQGEKTVCENEWANVTGKCSFSVWTTNYYPKYMLHDHYIL